MKDRAAAGKKRGSSPVAIEHAQKPRNRGIMPDADGYGRVTGPCGDTVEISIRVRGGKIVKCTFDTDGCGATIACGSVITVMATGKTVAQARRINQGLVLDHCGGLPPEYRHCARLAAGTLQKALADFSGKWDEPWKKLYPRQ